MIKAKNRQNEKMNSYENIKGSNMTTRQTERKGKVIAM